MVDIVTTIIVGAVAFFVALFGGASVASTVSGRKKDKALIRNLEAAKDVKDEIDQTPSRDLDDIADRWVRVTRD